MNKNEAKNILRDFLEFSEQYQVDDEALDYYVEQILDLENQACGLSLDDAHKQFGFPKKTLRLACRKGALSDPLSNLDIALLGRLTFFWAKAWFLRPQLMKFNKQERVRLLDAPEYENTWERRVYFWYLAQPDGLKDERN